LDTFVDLALTESKEEHPHYIKIDKGIVIERIVTLDASYRYA
jgi:hypothetical protein